MSHGRLKIDFSLSDLDRMNTKEFDKIALNVTKAMMAISIARLERAERVVNRPDVVAMSAHLVNTLFETVEEISANKRKEK